jgi:DEAD/DEAH box helicase domain-containing protein
MATNPLSASLDQAIAASHLAVADREEIPGLPPTLVAVPEALDPRLRAHLQKLHPDGLYSHQAQAITAFLTGEDLCLATSTASGKSLIFMACAIDRLLTEDLSKVLAFYPVRALIQDQIDKWEAILSPFGLTVGYIDGGVAMESRPGILTKSDVVLMTPDVAHAWLMSNLAQGPIVEFMAALGLLILDEAHVYDGVFGTNAAYFLRRLTAAAPSHRLIASTATLGEPEAFIRALTGRATRVFGPAEDGAGRQPKTVLLLEGPAGKGFDSTVALLNALQGRGAERFLAFGDSRKLVEQLVAALHRSPKPAGADGDPDGDFPGDDNDDDNEPDDVTGILPYRAGYEAEDRRRIQAALAEGTLSGVVSTSALELGIDIGEIGTVVLLDLPPTVKSLWQRLGRAGRKGPGVCLVMDRTDRLGSTGRTLADYLGTTLERNWLYLDNRFIQYAHALCAARECSDRAEPEIPEEFSTLPEAFRRMLANELDQSESVSDDLYALKQRAEAGPHREFPLRACTEQSFRVEGPVSRPMGELDFGHALREAYPGAIYHYMGRPHRVIAFRQRDGYIRVKRARYWTTRPIVQAMAFPNFRGGLLDLRASSSGFVAEVEIQVSERVTGFTEQRGSAKEQFLYGPTSPHHTRPLNRFFQTTGVCWSTPSKACCSEAFAYLIREAFGVTCALQERDLGVGMFHAKHSPLGPDVCQGICVYDLTYGSLRLTEKLAEEFEHVLRTAASIAGHRNEHGHEAALAELLEAYRATEPRPIRAEELVLNGSKDWVCVVAAGSKAMLLGSNGAEEVDVRGVRYTPQGLMYELTPPNDRIERRMVRHEYVQAIHGVSRMIRMNLVTGEEEGLE